MSKKKSKAKVQRREDMSNPHRHISHGDLLRKAEVKKFGGKYIVKELANGRIQVKSAKKT